MQPVFAKPRPIRPELVLLCDVSGSVAGLLRLHDAPRAGAQRPVQQGARVRLRQRDGRGHRPRPATPRRPGAATSPPRILREARITKWHTSSDYGEAFGDFRRAPSRRGRRRAPPCSILGDARNNNQDPNLGALHEIRERARRTFWLNPERHDPLGAAATPWRRRVRRGRRDARVPQRRSADALRHPAAPRLTSGTRPLLAGCAASGGLGGPDSLHNPQEADVTGGGRRWARQARVPGLPREPSGATVG